VAKDPAFHFCDAGALQHRLCQIFDLLECSADRALPDVRSIEVAGPGCCAAAGNAMAQHSELRLKQAAATTARTGAEPFSNDCRTDCQVIPHGATSSRHGEQAGSSEHGPYKMVPPIQEVRGT